MSKRILSFLIITGLLLAPLSSQAAVLGFATERDIQVLQKQIVDLAQQVVDIQAQLVYRHVGGLLGASTVTNGFNYPTSSYTFSDNDIINSGDFNLITQYLGTRASTDTLSVSYKLTNASSVDPGHQHTSSSIQGWGLFTNATATGNISAATASFTTLASSSQLRSPSSTLGAANVSTLNVSGAQNNSSTIAIQGLSDLRGGVSSTNITASGYIQVSGALTDPAGNKYSTSTGGGSLTPPVIIGSTFFSSNSTSSAELAVGGNIITGGATPTALSTAIASSTSFSFTGSTSSFVVPVGVSSITFNLRGGGGGAAGSTAGNGGSVTGTIAVAAGQIIYYGVGGVGANNTSTVFGGGGLPGDNSGNAASGGGRTWLSFDGNAYSNSTVLAVAGGGGGGRSSAGGAGGGLTGTAGTDTGNCGAGQGGTQSAGGAGGINGSGVNGNPGTAGNGGNGGLSGNAEGAGGGGGYFGGGGGSGQNSNCGGAGGGGSSFATSTITATSTGASGVATAGAITFSYNAGTSLTVQGTNNAGVIVSPTSTAITLTFAATTPATWSNPPACIMQPIGASSSIWQSATSTSAITFNSSVNTNTMKALSYQCFGY